MFCVKLLFYGINCKENKYKFTKNSLYTQKINLKYKFKRAKIKSVAKLNMRT